MPLKFHPRVDQLEPFLAMEVMERAFAMEREGARIIHFGVGEPGVPPPPEAVDACIAALRGGETRYTDSRGLAELRQAVAAEHARRSGQPVDPDQVLVTSGTSPAMLLVFGLLAGPGDEIILGTPHYPCYPNFMRFCGATPVFVATGPGDDWQLDPAAVRAALTPRTRAIVVGSPANPTGAVQSAEILEGLGALGAPLISDEIYHGLTYDGVAAASALGRAEHVFVLDGFSKRYAMTGFRLGYAVVPPEALRRLQVMQQNLFISANRFVQHAGVAALEHGAPMVERLRRSLDARRLRMVEGLRELGLGVERPPQGAFYVFADARRFGADSLRLAFDILERAQVACTPGIDFGQAGEGFLRFSYAASEADLEEGLKRLARGAAGADVKVIGAEFETTAADAGGLPREGLPEVAFLGRSNVGKSSLLNRLSGRRALARTSGTPGKTRLLHFFRLRRRGGGRDAELLFVDLPGYGFARVSRAERGRWQRLVEGYLDGRAPLRAAVLLQDLRRDVSDDELDLVAWLEERSIPVIVALTKCDKLKPMRRAARVRQLQTAFELPGERVVATSVTSGLGIDVLWRAIDAQLTKQGD